MRNKADRHNIKELSLQERRKILTQKKLRHTVQRDMVLRILMKSKSPLSAGEIYDLLVEEMKTKSGAQKKDAGKAINLSTVYRVLESFEDHEIVRRILVQNSPSLLYEIKNEDHKHHLICLACKKISSIDYCPIEESNFTERLGRDFVVKDHSLNLYGYCPDCTDEADKADEIDGVDRAHKVDRKEK